MTGNIGRGFEDSSKMVRTILREVVNACMVVLDITIYQREHKYRFLTSSILSEPNRPMYTLHPPHN